MRERGVRPALWVHPSQLKNARPGTIRVDGRVGRPLESSVADLDLHARWVCVDPLPDSARELALGRLRSATQAIRRLGKRDV